MALRKIVRNRPSLSCLACRRRKIKCEKQRPACANCVRLGDECVYESEAEQREKAAAKKRKTHQHQHQLDDPFDALDAHDAHDSLPPHESDRGDHGDNGSPVTDAELDAAAVGWTPPSFGLGFQWDAPTLDFDFDFDAHFNYGLLTPSLSLSSFPLDPACPLDTLPNRRDTSPLPGSPFEGYISTQDDGSKLFIERTFWALVSRDQDVYERILRVESAADRCKSVMNAGDHMTLPPKHVCGALLQCFFLCVHPLLPFVHAPTLAKRYGQLCTQLLGEQENIIPLAVSTSDPAFVALLWAAMYAGAVASAGTPLAASAKVPDTPTFRDNLYAAFASAMKAASFPEVPTLDALVAALIVQSGLGREDIYQLRSAQIVCTCIRAAQQLGLHREASRKGLGSVKSELGRRIWWHLIDLDIQSAVAAGTELQAARVEGSSDARMPIEFLEDQNVLAGENTPKSSAFLLFALGRAEIASAMRQIIVRAYDRQRPSQRDLIELNDMLSSLHSRIRAISARLPAKGIPEKGLVSSFQATVAPATHGTLYKDDASTTTVFNFWARSVLHMLYLKALILLQKRFLHVFTGQRHATLWKTLVRLCCQYIQTYLRLTRWSAAAVYKWALLSRLQPLEETLILLTYLQTESCPAEADLVEHFAEEVLDMCHNSEQAQNQQPPGITSSTRQKLWAILNELKEHLPWRPHPDLSWFSAEFNSSFVDSQWQKGQTSVVDLSGVDQGLASFLQLEGLTDT
ncbi:hypothetical protein P171DRAFT_521659 [Karstenula rhodostoma CBS 690.94]|uniref:Zn(2)-C6 fungal-type domain-containing protein n=1 Tax=Karstenula rhodostoma CBS 690.94 TaxID=1392251 RepID=A0A9P4UCM0_9PLEO|nr:hypothetical protein P171DRAFT_521659 [Karstenula rhodostoma CBS 690.94]